MIQENGRRLDWVDIFKGLAIISVVVGHSTGIFNMYIYQFHMAAFFFVSGLTSSLEKKRIMETVLGKLYTIILPYTLVFMSIFGGVTILNRYGFYHYLFKNDLIPFWKGISEFLLGRVYVEWLGATWFLVTLFWIYILQKVVLTLCKDRPGKMYTLLSILLFAQGYALVANKITFDIIPVDLVLIGQLYFYMGIMVKYYKVLDKTPHNNLFRIGLFLASIALMWSFGNMFPNTVDYPSRNFGFAFTNCISAANGILFLYLVSTYLDEFSANNFKRLFIIAGQYTLAVLFLHFMLFKTFYALLAAFGVVPWSYISEFIPTKEIGSLYWFPISVMAISFSIILWWSLMRSKIFRTLLGQDKNVYKSLCYKALRVDELISSVGKQSKNVFSISINHLLNIIKLNKALSIAIIVIVILCSAPMMIQGIICNDELQSRYWSMRGIGAFLKHFSDERLYEKGRALSALFNAVTMYIGFASAYLPIFRLVDVASILLDIFLYGWFLYKMFKNQAFAIFASVIALVFLPISFEHTAPNAFITLYNFPFAALLLSFITYIVYIEKRKKSYIYWTVILLFFSLASYEVFITLMPMYPLISFFKKNKTNNSWNVVLKDSAIPFATSVIYILLYITAGVVFPSSYDGNQIGGFTFDSAYTICGQLFKASFPGYFLFNSKYRYLFDCYSESKLQLPLDLIFKNCSSIAPLWFRSGNSVIKYIGESLLNLRTILLSGFVYGVLSILLKKNAPIFRHEAASAVFFKVGAGAIFVILPTLPLAVAKMYQDSVNESAFAALPTTYISYFAAVFLCCYVIFAINHRCRIRWITFVLVAMITIYNLPVQAMNSVFSKEQNRNYSRLITIEELFNTKAVKALNNYTVSAQDIYGTRNALYIHDNYWSEYAKLKGLNINLENNDSGQVFHISYPEDRFFVIEAEREGLVLSKARLDGMTLPVKLRDGSFISVRFDNGNADGDFYTYSLSINTNKKTATVIASTAPPFANLAMDAGNTLDTAVKISGYYSDGWVGNISEYKLMTGKKGEITISGYYPKTISGNLKGSVYIDNVKADDFKIDEQVFVIKVKAEPNKVVKLKIVNDFEFAGSMTDSRLLSFVLSGMVGE